MSEASVQETCQSFFPKFISDLKKQVDGASEQLQAPMAQLLTSAESAWEQIKDTSKKSILSGGRYKKTKRVRAYRRRRLSKTRRYRR